MALTLVPEQVQTQRISKSVQIFKNLLGLMKIKTVKILNISFKKCCLF